MTRVLCESCGQWWHFDESIMGGAEPDICTKCVMDKLEGMAHSLAWNQERVTVLEFHCDAVEDQSYRASENARELNRRGNSLIEACRDKTNIVHMAVVIGEKPKLIPELVIP